MATLRRRFFFLSFVFGLAFRVALGTPAENSASNKLLNKSLQSSAIAAHLTNASAQRIHFQPKKRDRNFTLESKDNFKCCGNRYAFTPYSRPTSQVDTDQNVDRYGWSGTIRPIPPNEVVGKPDGPNPQSFDRYGPRPPPEGYGHGYGYGGGYSGTRPGGFDEAQVDPPEVAIPENGNGIPPPTTNLQTQKAVALKALAGVALIGAAAALASNPVLLPISILSGRKKRSLKMFQELRGVHRYED